MTPIQGTTPIISPIADTIASPGQGASSPAGGFVDSLKSAIGKVNEVQMQANDAVAALMTGQTQDLHKTMVALQQADVSFQLMMQVRNKLIGAYEEIQRMQI